MQHSPNDIKEKLLRALDKDNNVVDMAEVIEVIDILEKIPITKDELERTRLGKHINELRKKTANENIAKRAKELVRRWRKLIIPQENSNATSGQNGERVLHNIVVGSSSSPCSITVTSHLPGPGPGPGLLIGGKPASPALANHLRVAKALGGLAQSSPGNSQCSSASTSPSVSTGISRLGSNRPATPRSSGNSLHLDGSGGRFHSTSNFQEFKQVSPALNAITGRIGTPSTSSPYGTRPVGNSLSLLDGGTGGRVHTNFQEFKSVSPAFTTAAAVGRIATPGSSSARHSTRSIASSPGTFHRSSPIIGDKRRIAGDAKRPRTDDDESCDSQGPALRFSASCVKNSSSPPPPEALINGVDAGDSMDSIRSYGDGNHSQKFKDSVVTETNLAKSKRKKRVRPERGDMLKEKLASHLRTPKVKTTAEIIKELKARNTTGSSGLQISPTLSEDRVRVPPIQEDASLLCTRKAVYSSLLGTDEDVTRNKSELMEKFLKDSVGSEVSLKLEGSQSRGLGGTFRESPNLSGQSSSQYYSKDGTDPVDAILATLPPINAADIRWEEDDEEDGVNSPEPPEVTDEMVQRLAQDEWESVNGNSDHQKNFKRWNEMSIQKSYSGDLLHILPYVDID